MTKLRGVNLGGWLVLEKWITPTLFDGFAAEDEYDFVQQKEAKKRLERHWKTFITEADLAWLADHGVNALRIPVGYWIFGDEPPFFGAIHHLDRIMNLAAAHHLNVLLCLHAAPGSQNGFQHSGDKGRARWHTNRRYQQKTLRVLERLVERYRSHPALWGIELLNEPRLGLFQKTLRLFYATAYRNLSKKTRVVFSDAFTPRLMSGALPKDAYLDVHWYHFGWIWHWLLPVSWYNTLLQKRPRLIRRLQRRNPVLVGEWSIVLSTHALRRYPKNLHEAMMDDNGRRQLAVYASADGWFYWTYKTEGRGLWNFRSLIEDGRLVLR